MIIYTQQERLEQIDVAVSMGKELGMYELRKGNFGRVGELDREMNEMYRKLLLDIVTGSCPGCCTD